MVIAGFEVSAKRYSPNAVLPRHAHERAVIGAVERGDGVETLAGHTLAFAPGTVFFRPGGHSHANHFGR